jgi:hypothetical protein
MAIKLFGVRGKEVEVDVDLKKIPIRCHFCDNLLHLL